MEYDYDIIVAGAGIAGMIAGTSAAIHSKQNLRILIIDRNDPKNAGRKTINGWVCGDAVGKNSVDYMTKAIGISWNKPEVEHPVKGVVAYSPDHETAIYFEGEGYILNRKLLPQKQLNDALKVGIEFDWNVNLTNVYHEDNQVKGVIGLKKEDGKMIPYKKRAKVVIDCTGVTSVLRTNLPIKSFIQRKIDRDDLESTGRYILEFDKASNDKTYFDPDYALIHLDQKIAPGGYAWVFPKGEHKANIGLGVQHKSLELRNRALNRRDDLKTLIDNYVKMNPVISNPRLANSSMDDGNAWGTWQVSVRRQNDCLVANGYMLVGDAAWMPKPLDAGGIGPAIIAGVLAGKNVVRAIEANDTSEEGLWQYNLDFVNDYGYKTAGLEVFRRFLQTLSNEQINYGMKHFLSKLDIEKITKGEHPEFSHIDKIGMMIRAITHRKTAEGLKYTAEKNKVLVELYRNYPKKPSEFEEWHKRLMKELNEAFEKFAIKEEIYVN
ncbi:MAG: NAD(P)/FAD-dependent oxidoreductase [Candidatus Nitrosothermus koennekii]|nr:MAG: NAD(P)/FAD-dependent oxidoreductase [Candidatus Nitrosothermus koennekii]